MASQAIDKDQLYGQFRKGSDWQQDLQKKATHMALDIPEDVNISAPKTTTVTNHNYPSGLITTIMAAIGALGLGIGGTALLTRPTMPAPQPPTVVAPTPATPATGLPLSLVQDVEQVQQPDGTWKEKWRGPARPKEATDKLGPQ